MHRSDLWVVLLLVLGGALLPALIAAASGLAEVPRNDDWSYRAISRHLYETGELRLDGASQSFAVGQVLAAMPLLWLFGGHEVAFFTVGVLFSALAVAAGYLLSRQFLDQFDACLVALALLVAPGYLAYSSSFMTDVPALALVLCCLLFGVQAVRQPPMDLPWASAAAISGAIAFSVRQFAIAAPAAVALAVVLAAPRRRRSWIVGGFVIGLSAAVALLQGALGGQVGATPVIEGGWPRAVAVVPSLALLLLPVTVRSLHLRHGLGGQIPYACGVAVAVVVVVAAIARGEDMVTLGNLLSPWGVPDHGYIVGGRPVILGHDAWLVLQLVALASAFFLADAAARTAIAIRHVLHDLRRDAPQQLHGLEILTAFVIITIGGLLAYATLWAFFDRYVWPLLIPLGILLLHVGPARSPARDGSWRAAMGRKIPSVATAMLALVAGAFALNSYAFDGARWRAGERLVALGERPEAVDAGYEWVGTHAPPPARVNDRQVRAPDPLTWYGNIWPNFRRCAIVAGAPLDVTGFALLEAETQGYPQFLVLGQQVPLYLYRSQSNACLTGAQLPRDRSSG